MKTAPFAIRSPRNANAGRCGCDSARVHRIATENRVENRRSGPGQSSIYINARAPSNPRFGEPLLEPRPPQIKSTVELLDLLSKELSGT
jgi:hypothetical protein